MATLIDPQYLSTGQAARFLGVSRHTLLRAARRGDIQPAFATPGGRLRFHPADVQAMANRLAAGPQATPATAPGTYDAYVEAFFQVPAPVCLNSPEGEWLLVNPAFCNLLGYPQDEVLTLGPLRLTHPDDARNARQAGDALISGSSLTARCQKRYRRANGLYVWVDVTMSLVRDEAGSPLYFVNQMQDITEQKLAEEARRASEDLLRSVVTTAPLALLAVDHLGTITLTEGSALHTLGLNAVEVVGKTIDEVFPAPSEFLSLAHGALRGQSVAGVVTIGGAVLDSRWTPLLDSQGQCLGAISISTDITIQKLAEHVLVTREARFRALIENAPIGACIIDADGNFEIVNAAYAEIYGFTPEHLLGHPARLVQDQAVERLPRACGSHAFQTGDHPANTEEYKLIRSHDACRVISVTTFELIGADGRPRRSCFVMDITDQKRQEELLAHEAHHDPLTGLPNRALFDDCLEHALHVAARERASLALFQIDLDHFKAINDRFGHAAGDEVLKTVAQRISGVLRVSDTVARVGGDEFAVILLHADEAGALQVAGKICAAVQPPIPVAGTMVSVGASVGISLFPEHAADSTTLLHYADQAMYAAKANKGGALVHALAPDPSAAPSLAADQRDAIANGQMQVWYQPVINTLEDRTARLSALMRWQHPQLGLIEAADFVPLAEQVGAIDGLTVWMLDQVLRQMQAWQRGGQSGDVSLTLSLSVLLDQHFPDLIDVLLRQYDVGAERLMLEVAEEAVMHQPEPAARAIKRLAGTGVRVVLCGMGARHTCLELVSCLPLSELKIDRAVIARLHSAHGPAMVGAILGLSRGLGLGLVADGVEDRRTREVLRTLGCRLMQGGYLCPPLTAPEVGPWLRAEEEEQPAVLALSR